MRYNFKYKQGARSFKPDFGRVINAGAGIFERGYTAGYTEGEKDATTAAEAHNAAILTDCNAVLPDKGVKPAETLAQVPQRIEEIQSYSDGYDVGLEDGKQSEYDRFWDTFQEKGKRKTYNHAFYVPHTSYATALPCWNDDTFRPKYPITCRAGNGGDYMLTFSMVTRIPVRIEVYRYDSQTEKLLYNNPYLHTVEELWVQKGCTFSGWFTNDTALRRLKMAPGSVISNDISFVHCILDDIESLESILWSLYDFNSYDPDNAYTRTIKFNSACLAILQDYWLDGVIPALDYITECGWNY